MERPANVVRASDNSPCLPWTAQLTFIQVHLFCWRDWSTFADMFSMPRGETARFLVRRQTRAPGSCCAAASTTFELFVRLSLRTKKNMGPRDSSQRTCGQSSRSMAHDYLVSRPSPRIENLIRIAHAVEVTLTGLQKSVRISIFYRFAFQRISGSFKSHIHCFNGLMDYCLLRPGNL